MIGSGFTSFNFIELLLKFTEFNKWKLNTFHYLLQTVKTILFPLNFEFCLKPSFKSQRRGILCILTSNYA